MMTNTMRELTVDEVQCVAGGIGSSAPAYWATAPSTEIISPFTPTGGQMPMPGMLQA